MIKYLKKLIVICLLVILLVLTIRIVYYIENEKLDNKDLITYYNNIVIINGKENRIKCLIDNRIVEYKTISNLKKEYDNVIGDINIKNNKVVAIKIKPSIIKGKLLAYDGRKVEIDNYGEVKCTDSVELYSKEEDEYKELKEGNLRVGMDDIIYVLEKDKICAIIVENRSYNSKNIRVLIKTGNYSGIIHNYVDLRSKDELELLYVDDVRQTSGRAIKEKNIIGKVDNVDYTVKNIRENHLLRIKPSSKYFSVSNRIIIRCKNNKGILLSSIERATKGLKYYGQLELVKTKKGIVVINELDIEKYLYSVIPSEMPESYGLEALKVQAICARTYAYSQLNNTKYKKYGANIDDSISYQVYNNQKYGKDTIKAVDDTRGKVIKYNGKIANIFYYSTSCGYSSNTRDVFGGDNIGYLVSKKQAIDSDNNYEYNSNIGEEIDIHKEKNFRKFILSTDEDCFEKNCEWFRWKIIWDVDKLTRAINGNLSDVCAQGENKNITVYDKRHKKYICKSVSNIGKVNDIRVKKRGSGGVVTQIIIYGSRKQIKVKTQYTIRKIIGPNNATLVKNNNAKVKNMEMLPSCYFIIDKKEKRYVIVGGGYGHGIGMSQCGVNELVKLGKKYNEIIQFYFNNTSIEYY